MQADGVPYHVRDHRVVLDLAQGEEDQSHDQRRNWYSISRSCGGEKRATSVTKVIAANGPIIGNISKTPTIGASTTAKRTPMIGEHQECHGAHDRDQHQLCPQVLAEAIIHAPGHTEHFGAMALGVWRERSLAPDLGRVEEQVEGDDQE